ncbi:hypothetical protein FMM68_00115 [Lachnospiraceae bacterium MD329]|nr:hypothetical protein [Lachnospiraceae bacterium MD329]
MRYYHSWSGGKDSTAAVILDHIHNLPSSTIVFSEVMFDKTRNISGELPEHIDFIKNKAIPIFIKWGYDVKIAQADKDYITEFHTIIRKSNIPHRNGQKRAFPLGGKCSINRDIKTKAIQDFFKTIDGDYIQYVGIAADEPKRLERLNGTNKVSLLAKYGYTEQMAYELCQEYDLLSPIYSFTKRNGCWFCPNQSYAEMAHLKKYYPYLWRELEKLSQENNLVTQGFKYNATFAEVNAKVDKIIKEKEV